jgi:acyl-CoA dehydrogenase
MDFEYSARSKEMQSVVRAFMAEHILPREEEYEALLAKGVFPVPFFEELKSRAKKEGLWNLFLPGLKDGEPGTRLSNMDYAPIAEIMGRVYWASEVFNCSAPDTGNMEVLHLVATPEQKERWLKPLLAGEIRSCFAMTEPAVASSDPTNLRTEIKRDGDSWVITGKKWFTSGAANPRCKISIVLGVSDAAAKPHDRMSMVLVPLDTPGVTVGRNLSVMGQTHPEGHCEVDYAGVRVPAANLLGKPGDGFRIAQQRLGPGRVHHCMRAIGQAEHALSLMRERAKSRVAFGRPLADHGQVSEWIALSRIEIDQARLLVLKAAWLMDRAGNEGAKREVAMIKVIVPRMLVAVADRAIQTYGAAGLTPDTPLAAIWTWGRCLRIVDGPDEVHLRTIARQEITG